MAIISTGAGLIHDEVADHTASPIFILSALEALRSSAAFGRMVLAAFLNGVVTSLCIVAVLVLFRLILRRTWLASMVLIVIVFPVITHGTSVFDIVLAVFLATLNLAVLLRVGVVAHMAMLVVTCFLTWLPLSLDPNAWYFGQSVIVLFLIGGLATYGFLVALGGRPALGVFKAT